MASDNRLFKLALDKAGKYYIIELTRELISLDKKVTGNLIGSLDYSIIGSKDKLRLTITAAPYLGVIDKGRKRGATPPPFKPILKWVQMRGIIFTNKKTNKPMTQKQTAYAVKYGIRKNGIDATNVLDNTMKKFLNNKVIINQIKDGAKDMVTQLIQDTFKDIREKTPFTGRT